MGNRLSCFFKRLTVAAVGSKQPSNDDCADAIEGYARHVRQHGINEGIHMADSGIAIGPTGNPPKRRLLILAVEAEISSEQLFSPLVVAALREYAEKSEKGSAGLEASEGMRASNGCRIRTLAAAQDLPINEPQQGEMQ